MLKSCVLCYKQYKQKFSKKGKQDSNPGAVHGGDQIVQLNHKVLGFFSFFLNKNIIYNPCGLNGNNNYDKVNT